MESKDKTQLPASWEKFFDYIKGHPEITCIEVFDGDKRLNRFWVSGPVVLVPPKEGQQ